MQIADVPLKDVLTILLSAITASITAYNWRAARFRSKLKDDLEILRRYREEFKDNSLDLDDKRYNCLRDKIQKRMYRAYVVRGTDMSDMLSGIAFLTFAFLSALLPEKLDLVWRIGLAILFASFGFGFIYAARKDHGKERGLAVDKVP